MTTFIVAFIDSVKAKKDELNVSLIIEELNGCHDNVFAINVFPSTQFYIPT
jgi:hypothetical protein